ncbi:hypothetical protein BVY03_04655 [bacterium K02(2017)]|nr:hypothetical protein BVY03_04655 [bacterium K02(2017)]
MSTVILTTKKNIAIITLNIPKQLNAMSDQMAQEFKIIISKIKKDKKMRVVIITGAGKAFSSGGNIKMLSAKTKTSKAQNNIALNKFYQIFLSIQDLPQPVIAAINGVTVGGGLCLALACDLKYASTQAKFYFNFAKMGLAPGMGTTQFLLRSVGSALTAEILFRAKSLDAKTALKQGLINGIYSSKSLMTNCLKIAEEIALLAPLTLTDIKRGIAKSQDKQFKDILKWDAQRQANSFATQDLKEGFQSLLENRKAIFTGK